MSRSRHESNYRHPLVERASRSRRRTCPRFEVWSGCAAETIDVYRDAGARTIDNRMMSGAQAGARVTGRK